MKSIAKSKRCVRLSYGAIALLMWMSYAGPTWAEVEGVKYYFSNSGSDSADCKFGSSDRPWRSLAFQYAKGCIEPGAKIFFMKGVYQADSDIFKGRLNLHGSNDKPILISADPNSGEKWPVTFLGHFVISNAEHLVIDGIEFVRKDNRQPVLAIGASHITIRNSMIHGLEGDFNKYYPSSGDCIKIAGGMKMVEDIKIISNEIYNCSEDAIDITGRKKIEVRGNYIHHAWLMQVKGGAEDVIIEGNRISDMHYGITGNGMDCSADNIYCGSPRLPKLPVDKRFEANNVTIANNDIVNIWVGRAIDFSGWRNTNISDNRIINGNIRGGAVLEIRNVVGSVFLDGLAEEYCKRVPGRCMDCRLSNNLPCWKIKLQSENIRIFNNHVEGKNPLMMKIDESVLVSPSTICEKHNQFIAYEGTPTFIYGNDKFKDVRQLPICHDF